MVSDFCLRLAVLACFSCDTRNSDSAKQSSQLDFSKAAEILLGPIGKFTENWTELDLYRVGIVREDQGGLLKFAAISLVCTHQPCLLRADVPPGMLGRPSGFTCPCHGSRFSGEGQRISGPAKRALIWQRLRVSESNELILVLGQKVSPQWRLEINAQ